MGTGGFGTAYANFNLSTGAVGTTTGITVAQAEDLGNGWYRCEVTATATATASTTLSVQLGTGDQGISYTGDGTSGIYIYGAQLEQGAFPTSYIPTSGATATRSADVASMSVDAFGYNQSEGSVVVEATLASSSYASNANLMSFADSGNADFTRLWVWSGADNSIRWAVTEGGATQVDSTRTYTEQQDFVVGAVYSTNDFAVVLDGGSAATDTSGSVTSDIAKLNVGSKTGSTEFMTGHIKSIRYYPRRLTNAQLQEITS